MVGGNKSVKGKRPLLSGDGRKQYGGAHLPDFKLNFFRSKKIKEKFFISTDMGSWVLLSESEYARLLDGDLDVHLFKKLEKVGIVLTDSNKEWVMQQYRRNYWHLITGTSLHIIVPTLRCNHSCVYCYANRVPESAEGYDMTVETATKVVDFIFQSPASTITIEFTGGEPLLNFSIVKYIVEYSEKLNKKFKKSVLYALVTNGVLLDRNMIEFFIDHNVGLCISLDGPKDVHDNNRKYLDGSGTYDDVIKSIRLLHDAFKEKKIRQNFNLIPTISRYSLLHWKEIVDEYVKLDFRILRFKFVNYFGFAERFWKEIGYTPQEYLPVWEKAFDYCLELTRKGKPVIEQMGLYVTRKIIEMRDIGFCELQVPCGAARGQIVYNYDGGIYPCDESRTFPELKIGSVYDNSYEEVLSGPIVTAFLNMSSNLSLKCDSCAYYSFCGLCPLQAYSERKNIRPHVPGDMKGEIHRGMIDHILGKIVGSEKGLAELKDSIRRANREHELNVSGRGTKEE